MENLDFDKIANIAIKTMHEWIPTWNNINHSKSKNGQRFIISPIREDHSPDSFNINEYSGIWNDFATEENGSILDLYCKITGKKLHELGFLQKDNDIFLDELLTKLKKNEPPARFGFTNRWFYGNEFCSFWIYRYDTPEGKQFHPWSLINGKWECKKPEKPKNGFPLLNLDKILREKDKTIVIVEGEKSSEFIPEGYVSTTWAGGANSTKSIDFSPLKGRTIIIWPDNDEPGLKCMEHVKEELNRLNCKIAIVEQRKQWEKGSDAADLKKEEIEEVLKSVIFIEKKEERSLFPITFYGDSEITQPKWIIKGILEDNSLGLIFGSSGSGKSYLAIDMAACIASGKDFCGHKIKKQGVVIYIAGEGFSGISRRLKAWELKHGISLKEAPIGISHKACSLGDPDLMVHVEQEIDRILTKNKTISCIIIDTWARNMIGDENSTQDTSNAIKSLDAIKLKYDCSALIIHHSGQAEAERARGSSALRAALDVEYRVTLSKDEIICLQNTKMKDGDPPENKFFAFDHIDLGIVDEDGKVLFSAALEPTDCDSIVEKGKNLVHNETKKIILDALKDQKDGMTSGEIIKVLEKGGRKRATFYKNIEKMTAENSVKRVDNRYFFID